MASHDSANRFYKEMPEPGFPVDIIHRHFSSPGQMTTRHWHEHMQFFWFTEGTSCVYCGNERIIATGGDLIILNPQELHSAECLSAPLTYDVIRVDFAFLSSKCADACQTLFIEPLIKEKIIFQNLVRNDTSVSDCIKLIVYEYERKETGYELAIKSALYRLLVLLFRSYCIRRLSEQETDARKRTIERLSRVLDYIETNIAARIKVADLASLTGVTEFHFCKIFRSATGLTPVEYINRERVERAERMLRETGMTITEIASACGFDDANYFSRLFKRYRGVSPKQIRSNTD